jgi:two-component sensor histidine kinase/ActR/RegA family two-component response regulator
MLVGSGGAGHGKVLQTTIWHLFAGRKSHLKMNVLAVVLSLLRLAPRDGDCETFVAIAEGRINAMARAHSLLASEHWQGVNLETLLRDEVKAQADRAAFSGPAVQLGPVAAQPLAMALHELATNAAKYGALSTPDGRVQISWQMDNAVGGLLLRWEEFGGPPITAAPARRGFGSRLLESLLRRQLSGSLTQEWNAAGLRAQLILPVRYASLSRIVKQAVTEVGQATAFSVAITQPQNRPADPPKRVLLVEDEMLLALELEKTIRELGYVVVGPARSLVEAVALASSEPELDAAVLDVNLGGGERVFPVVDILVTRGVPFLFVTGYGSSGSLEGYDKAALAVLPKPYDRHALANAVEAAVMGKRVVTNVVSHSGLDGSRLP